MPVGSCTHVLWDFNGTLLDDLDVAVAAVSDMLVSRGREPMTRAWYYELMEMPIIRYYEKLFDLSQVPFETLSREFVEGYARHFSLAHLAPGAREAVSRFAAAGCRQVVLSSFEQQRLLTILQELELADAFEAVLGAREHPVREQGRPCSGLAEAKRGAAGSGAGHRRLGPRLGSGAGIGGPLRPAQLRPPVVCGFVALRLSGHIRFARIMAGYQIIR